MRKRIVDIDWAPYLTRVQKLTKDATDALNDHRYEYAHFLLLEIERNAFNCRHWLKENVDGKAA